MGGLVQVVGGIEWWSGAWYQILAWCGLGGLHIYKVNCLSPFSSRIPAAHLFRAGWLPEGLTAQCTQDSQANEPFSNENCLEWCLDFGSGDSDIALLLLREPGPECLSYRQRQGPVSSPGKRTAFHFLWRGGICSLLFKTALSY